MGVRKKQGMLSARSIMATLATASLFLLLLVFADSSRFVAPTSLFANTFWTMFRAALISALSTSIFLTILATLGFALRRSLSTAFTAASVLAIPIALGGGDVVAAAMAAGVFVGVGFAFTSIGIQMELHRLPHDQSLFVIGAGLFLAALFKLFLVIAFPNHLGTAVWLSLYAMEAFLLAATHSEPPPHAETATSTLKHDLGTFLRRNWIGIGCLLLCVYTIGCIWGANSESLVISSDASPNVSAASALGSLLAGTTLLAVAAAAARKKPTTSASAIVSALCNAGPLACISLLVVAWLLQTSGLNASGPSASSNPVLGFCCATIGAVFLTAFARESCTHSALGLAACLANTAVLGGALLIMSLYPYLGDALAHSVSISLRIVFLTIVAFSFWHRRPQQENAEINCRKRELALRYGLSNREIEILALLLEKRSVPYIAKKLFISDNTVKTHVRRIYEKTSVHSRDELIDLFQR